MRAPQNSSYPTASIAGTDGPAAARVRTAVGTSGHSLTTSTVPRSRSPNPEAREHLLDRVLGVALLHTRRPVARGGQLDDLEEVRHQSQPVEPPPERDPHAALGDENALRLGQCTFASLPYPIEAGDDIEAVVGEGEGEHVSRPEAPTGRPCRSDRDELFGRIDPRYLCTPASRHRGGVTGPAGDVQQADPRTDSESIEEPLIGRKGVRLHQVGPFGGPRSPSLAGYLPVHPIPPRPVRVLAETVRGPKPGLRPSGADGATYATRRCPRDRARQRRVGWLP